MEVAHLTVAYRDDGVLAVGGELDLATAAAFDEALSQVVPDIRLDLDAVTFIDSVGLRSLLRAHQRDGTTLRVVAASREVRRVFALCGVARTLLCCDSI